MTNTTLYNQTIDQLRECYDTHAEKFSSTRKKRRPELEYIVGKLVLQQQETEKSLSIIELGCGDGRLFGYIEERYPSLIANYTGIDISSNLLSIAKKSFSDIKKAQRIHDDMIHYLSTCDNESVDVVICMASFQHLPDYRSRNIFLHHVYRVLLYNGSLCSVDWSWSSWMLHKHGKLLRDSIKETINSLGKREWNNLMIPFTDQGIIKERLYHIFTIFELKRLLSSHGFHHGSYIYSSQNGSFHHNILKARNICTYVQKKIFY